MSSTGTSQSCLYVIATHMEFEASPNIFTGTLHFFSYDVYYLPYPRSTLSYLTPYMVVRFSLNPKGIFNHFLCLPSYVILLWIKGFIRIV